MTGKLRQKVSAITERLLIERELFLRADGKVRYARVSRHLQVSIIVAILMAAAWVTYSSVNVVFHHQIVAGRDSEIERQRLAYLDLLTEVSEYHQQFTQITRNLEENQNYLLSLLARTGQAKDELANVEWQLKKSQTERARVALARDGLRQRLAMFEADLNLLSNGNPALKSKLVKVAEALVPGEAEGAQVVEAQRHVTQRLRQVETELSEVTISRGELETTVASLNQQLEYSQDARRNLVDSKRQLRRNVDRLEQQLGQTQRHQDSLEMEIAALQSSLGVASVEGERLQKERSFLQTRVAGFEQRLVGMRDTQQAIVDRLSERTTLSIDTFEQTVAMTGLDVNSLLSGLDIEGLNVGQGGPFIPGDYVVEDNPIQSLQASTALLDMQMDRWEGLQQVVRSIPLTAPLDQFRITSTFGPRTDPVNGRTSSHYGMDLAAPMHTPVMSTAPGRVVFAGWKGRYGRVIVIDHGHGIRTRYAHLRKMLVKAGQKVGHRDKIALLGSSGRSTGPHVHYEVQVNGKSRDPMKFLKAGKYVFKG